MERVVGWPAWRYGPNGECAVFATADDVPPGWVDHPGKVSGDDHEKPRRGRPRKVDV